MSAAGRINQRLLAALLPDQGDGKGRKTVYLLLITTFASVVMLVVQLAHRQHAEAFINCLFIASAGGGLVAVRHGVSARLVAPSWSSAR